MARVTGSGGWRAAWDRLRQWVLVDAENRSQLPDRTYRKPQPPEKVQYSFPENFPTKTDSMSGDSPTSFHGWHREYREPHQENVEVSLENLGKQALEPLEASGGQGAELQVESTPHDWTADHWEDYGPEAPPAFRTFGRKGEHDTSSRTYEIVT